MKNTIIKNRLQEKLFNLKSKNKKALVLFVTAGYPKLNSTIDLVLELADSGADVVEIGMPFSDPLADGPIIQASSQQAIKNGITLPMIFEQIKEIRRNSNVPIVLMGYLNPIMNYGEEKFFNDAKNAVVDGVILPEIPLEESAKYISLTKKYNIANVMFVSPLTTAERIKQTDKLATGFVYCVSTTGVTGKKDIGDIKNYLTRVKNNVKKNSVLVGFGIKTPEDAQKISQYADGVIIGSALINKIGKGESIKEIKSWVGEIKEAM